MERTRSDNSAIKDRVDGLFKDIEAGVKSVYTSENYRNYILTMSKFRQYSLNNTILLYAANASLVAGYKKWAAVFHRHVKRGEKGIQILGGRAVKYEVEKVVKDTFGNPKLGADGKILTKTMEFTKMVYFPVTVFDISQTEGEPLPELVRPLIGTVAEYQRVMDALEKISPYPIEYVNADNITMPGANGVCSHADHKIQVLDDMSQIQTVKTLIHEIAHAQCHIPQDVEMAEHNLSREVKEIEAESIACIVADHLGLDTSSYSFAYVASWAQGKETQVLHDSGERIKAAAFELIDRIDMLLPEYAVPALDELMSGDKEAHEKASESRGLMQHINDAIDAANRAAPREPVRSTEHER